MTPAEVLSQLRGALDACAGLDVAGLPAVAQTSYVEELHALASRLSWAQTRALAAADAVEASVVERGRVTRSWLVEDLHESPTMATKRARVARDLAGAAVLEAAWRAGDVSLDHADAVLRCLRELPEEHRGAAEAILVSVACSGTPGDVLKMADEIRVRVGLDDSADRAFARRRAGRGVGLDTTFGGFGVLTGTLTPDVREQLAKALQAAAVKTGPEDERSPGQRRHDALGEIAAFFLAHGDIADDSGERPRVIVTMPLELLERRAAEAAGATLWATIGDGVPVPAAVARRLACDADIVPAVLGAKSEVLDLGRSVRPFNAAIRRAAWLEQRGTCAYPRCRRRVRECHHVVWWSMGGSSSLDNAAWLCLFHHWLVHDGGWRMRKDGAGEFTFTSPDGREFRRRTVAA